METMPGATEYPPIVVTVDLVILTVRDDQLQALTVRRGEAPYLGDWALPGGFLRPDEDLDAAAARELLEETGLSADHVHVEQLGSYGAPDRDPRMRVVTVAYIALAADLPPPTAGTDADEARWQSVAELLEQPGALAFDHEQILRDGVERARAKLEYTPLAAAFCASEFTVSELRHVYEVVWGTQLDPRNFHRKVTKTDGFLEPTGTTTRDGGRPARLYRAGGAAALHPPLLRVTA
jgi:8-oxo-dGTP diphosphatase